MERTSIIGEGGGATELIVGPSHVSVGRNYTHALLGWKKDEYVKKG